MTVINTSPILQLVFLIVILTEDKALRLHSKITPKFPLVEIVGEQMTTALPTDLLLPT